MRVTVSWGAKNTSGKFLVYGTNLKEALRELSARGEWGRFEGRLSHQWKGDARGNALSVTLVPSFTITMPVWRAYPKQPQECKDAWDAMWRALQKHEDGHRAIFENGVLSLTRTLESLTGVTGTVVERLIGEGRAAIQRRHDEFDRETDHGRSRGVELTISEKCGPK